MIALSVFKDKTMDISRTFSSIFIVFYFANSHGEEYTVSGDPRGTPEAMNNNGGSFLNIFSAMTATQAGWITNFDYFAHQDGGTYLSIWKYVAPTSFTMRGKIYFDAYAGYHEHIVPFQHQIQVHTGDMVGVHFPRYRGTLMYERTTGGFTSTFNETQLFGTYILDSRDWNDNWQIGHPITTNAPEKKGVALRVFINCCSENECARPCPLHCKNNLCDDTSAACTSGCVAGYMGIYCEEECNFGQYGENCESSCSSNCKDSTIVTCHSFNGQCPRGCVAGYHGNLCTTECGFGEYGENCESSCSSNCKDSETVTCNRFNGHCSMGCIAGYRGDHCNIDCSFGEYGENCESSCSNNCLDSHSVACNKINGHCSRGCTAGYRGDRCNRECDFGTYGENCESSCSNNCLDSETVTCDRFNGSCLRGCITGYFGDQCTIGCPPQRFGPNCNQYCSINCYIPYNCASADGVCIGGCSAGFEGDTCSEVCEGNRYGQNCSYTCHCRNGAACDSILGTCPNGCASGFQGRTCSSPSKNKKADGEDAAPLAGMIGGIAAAALIVVLIAVIVPVTIRKKRAKRFKYLEANTHCNSANDEIAYASDNTPSITQVQNTESHDTSEKTYKMETGIIDELNSFPVTKPVIPKKPDVKGDHKTAETAQYSNVASIQELSNPIDVGSFREFMAKEKSLDCTTLRKEYMIIPAGQTASWDIAKNQNLILKNKFKNILPYDKNRVVLRNVGDDPLSHYINASFVDGYTKENKFIASHGPRVPTIDDFWRMIWEYDVTVIVMVTNLVEEGKEKCVRYWPDEGTSSYDDITVTLIAEEQWQDYVVRECTIAKGKQERHVSQFHYIGWPDHGVPLHASGLLTMVHRVKIHASRHDTSPVVVHCSAGVGRTGTFIALDWLLDQAEKKKKVDILKCVAKLRTFRINMVQSSAQYIFIYDTMNETLLLGQTSICCNEISDIYHNLSASKQREDKLEVQFKYLEDTKPYFLDEEFDTATSATNKKKNRDKTVLPAEKHRVAVLIEGSDSYINAVSIQGYRTESKYYATQLPLDETIVSFWQMTWQCEITTIVALETTEDCEWFPKKGETLLCGNYDITTTAINEQNGFSVYTIEMALHSDSTEYYNVATPNQEPTSVISVLTLDETDERHIGTSIISMYIEITRQGSNKRSPTAVLCRNGSRLTGLYIACSVLFDMCSAEQEFDVFQVVQKIRRTRPQFIGSLEQYKQLYEIVKEFSTTESEYFNVK